MSEYNIIGDVHGHHDLLMKLVNKMPDVPFFSLGDMIDRGPGSLEVLRFFMKEGNRAVLGNHEHLMLDFYFGRRFYQRGIWFDYRNGGYQTLKSFAPLKMETWELLRTGGFEALGQAKLTIEAVLNYLKRNKKKIFPEDVMAWVDSLPVYHEEEGLFLSHAPRNPHASLEQLKDSKAERMHLSGAPQNLLWGMVPPGYIEGITQIYGHIIYPKPVYHRDDEKGIYAIGIDTLGKSDVLTLTGIHWPSRKIYQASENE